MLLVHRRDIVEPVEIGQRLEIGLVLDQLLGAAMEQPDMRIDAVDHLAVELEHEPQHAVRRRMLRAEIDGELAVVVASAHGQCMSLPWRTDAVCDQLRRGGWTIERIRWTCIARARARACCRSGKGDLRCSISHARLRPLLCGDAAIEAVPGHDEALMRASADLVDAVMRATLKRARGPLIS